MDILLYQVSHPWKGEIIILKLSKNVKNCYILVPGKAISILQSYTRYFYLNEVLTLASNLASLTNQSRCCSVSHKALTRERQ